MTPSQKNHLAVLQARFYGLALVIILIWALSITRAVVVPIAWGFLFAAFLLPFVEWMEKKGMKRGIAILIAVLLFTLFIGGVLYVLSAQVVAIGRDLPDISSRFSSVVARAQTYLVEMGLFTGLSDIKETLANQLESVMGWLFGNISSLGQSFFEIFLMPIYIYFILLYRDLPSRFVEAKYAESNQEVIKSVFQKVQDVIRNYIVGIMLLTLLTAAMDWVILFSFGVKYAFFFAVMIAILNLIPYIGNLIAMVVVGAYAFVTFDRPLIPIIVLALLLVANAVQENVIRPWIVGSSTNINAFVVFLSFIIGALLWGVSGMILFIPLVGIIKIVLEEVPSLKPYSIFLKEWNYKPREDENMPS